MKKKVLIFAVCASMVITFGACKKKAEEQPQQQAVPPSPHGSMTPGVMVPKGETKVVVPDNVKGKWNAVVIAVEDKSANKAEDVTIALNSEYKIPNSDVTIQVGDFLPDFKMDGLTITSASDQPNNPAVHVKVMEGGQEVFKGWLYSKFPTIHPFQHEKFGLTLKEATKVTKKG